MTSGNSIAYNIGVFIGRLLKFWIYALSFIFLMTLISRVGEAQAQKPKIEKVEKVKQKTHKKRHYKKCACECKKVVDATRKVDYNNFIGPRD